ncbi:hypothetical protein JCM11491_001604 [Sporobolomyces phaffii]
MDHLAQRFDDGYYYLNSALCVPFPVVLAARLLPTPHLATLACLAAAPVLLVLSVLARSSTDTLESLHAALTLQLRLLNLFGFIFSRYQLGTGKTAVALYALAWLATSFFYPQPPYLGPKQLRGLSTDEFDTQVLLLPSAQQAALDFASPRADAAKVVELAPDGSEIPSVPSGGASPASPRSKEGERTLNERWNLVLFHADWSKKSRQLELTLSRLSYLYDSRALKFWLVSPESAPGTFYDLSLSTSPTTTDLPLVRMYRAGRVVHEEPMSEREAKRMHRSEKRDRQSFAQKPRARTGGRDEDSGSESEDERDVERKRAVARYRWDRSAAAIERAFKLRERSGIAAPPSS